MTRRFLAIVLSLVLALGLCGVMPTGVADEGEKYTYTLATYFVAPPTDDVMSAYWGEKFGVEFKLEYIEQASYWEILNTRIASQDIPDVINIGSLANVLKYSELGVLGGFSEEFMRENMPYFSGWMDANYSEGWALSKVDDLIYTLPAPRSYNVYNNLLVWRTDWLENVGMEMPTTIDEMEAAVYAFRNNDPDGNGLQDTYGLSAGAMSAVYGAFGAMPGNWIKDDNGDLVYGSVTPGARNALELLAKWYKDGVLDPEYITGENSGGYWALNHSFGQGRVGVTSHGQWYHWMDWQPGDASSSYNCNIELLRQTNPDADYGFGTPPAGPEGKRGISKGNPFTARSAFSSLLTADEGKTAKLLQIIDTWSNMDTMEDYLTMRMGIKGTHWEYNENGTAVGIDPYVSPEAQAAIGAHCSFLILEMPEGEMELLPDLFNFAKGIFDNNPEMNNAYYQNELIVTTEAITQYQTDCQKLLNDGYAQIITGAQGIDYFDEMVQRWYDMGGTQMTEEVNEWWSTMK